MSDQERDTIDELMAELERRHIPYSRTNNTIQYTAYSDTVVECRPFGDSGIWYEVLPESDYVEGEREDMLERLFELCEPMGIVEPLVGGTLTAEQVREAFTEHRVDIVDMPDWEDRDWAEKCAIRTPDWQAIADELNTLTMRTCKMVPTFTHPVELQGKYQEWVCSECHEFTLVECIDGEECPNHCASCGRKVVEQ